MHVGKQKEYWQHTSTICYFIANAMGKSNITNPNQINPFYKPIKDDTPWQKKLDLRQIALRLQKYL